MISTPVIYQHYQQPDFIAKGDNYEKASRLPKNSEKELRDAKVGDGELSADRSFSVAMKFVWSERGWLRWTKT